MALAIGVARVCATALALFQQLRAREHERAQANVARKRANRSYRVWPKVRATSRNLRAADRKPTDRPTANDRLACTTIGRAK